MSCKTYFTQFYEQLNPTKRFIHMKLIKGLSGLSVNRRTSLPTKTIAVIVQKRKSFIIRTIGFTIFVSISLNCYSLDLKQILLSEE